MPSGNPEYLSTAEAAERMGVSERTVRDLCRRGLVPGAFQERDNAPWHAPAVAVATWVEQQTSDTPGPPTWWQRFRYRPWAFYPTVAFMILATVLGLLAALISAGADIGGARQQLQEWGWIRAFPPASEDEVLIVIASFHYAEGTADTDAHNEIRRAIQEAVSELDFSHLRVEVAPTRLAPDDRTGVERLGKRYNASVVIWGTDTGVRVTVSYLNLKHPLMVSLTHPIVDFLFPDFKRQVSDYFAEMLAFLGVDPLLYVTISETQLTQLANPSAYARFITQDLPSQLTFLSLFAIGQTYYYEEAYADSARVTERAVNSLAPEVDPPEGLAEAYLHLAMLYEEMGDDEQAIANYNQAITLNPSNAMAYYSRGLIRLGQDDLEGAITDLDQVITLSEQSVELYPDLAPSYGALSGPAYMIQGIAYMCHGMARLQVVLEGIIADMDDSEQAITNLDQAADFVWDVIAVRQGDLEEAITDFDQVIALSERAIEFHPDLAPYFNTASNEAYWFRGVAHILQGDLEAAIADSDQVVALSEQATELDPERSPPHDALSSSAYLLRAAAHILQGDLEAAIADSDQVVALSEQATELDPERSPPHDALSSIAYLLRAAAHYLQGNLEKATVDLDHIIAISPGDAWIYAIRGMLHQQLGNVEAALADFRRCLELRPIDDFRLCRCVI